MAYAINANRDGWRVVGSEADLLPGETTSETQPELETPLEILVGQCEAALQSLIDSGAKAWGYDSLISAASYANSTNPQFKAEALALITWRDEIWAWAYTQESAMKAGTEPVPTDVTTFVSGAPVQPTRPVTSS